MRSLEKYVSLLYSVEGVDCVLNKTLKNNVFTLPIGDKCKYVPIDGKFLIYKKIESGWAMVKVESLKDVTVIK